MAEVRAGTTGRLVELLRRTRGTNQLAARADLVTLGPLRLHAAMLTKDDNRLRGEATLSEAELAAALPGQLRFRPVEDGWRARARGRRRPAQRPRAPHRPRRRARDRARGPARWPRLATLFKDSSVQVTEVGSRTGPGGFTLTAAGTRIARTLDVGPVRPRRCRAPTTACAASRAAAAARSPSPPRVEPAADHVDAVLVARAEHDVRRLDPPRRNRGRAVVEPQVPRLGVGEVPLHGQRALGRGAEVHAPPHGVEQQLHRLAGRAPAARSSRRGCPPRQRHAAHARSRASARRAQQRPRQVSTGSPAARSFDMNDRRRTRRCPRA